MNECISVYVLLVCLHVYEYISLQRERESKNINMKGSGIALYNDPETSYKKVIGSLRFLKIGLGIATTKLKDRHPRAFRGFFC